MVERESLEQAKYRVRMAKQAVRRSKRETDAERTELRKAQLDLKSAKIQVREHVRRGKAVRQHERRRKKGLFETRAHYAERMRIEAVEAAPLR